MRDADVLVAIQANAVMADRNAQGMMTLRLPALSASAFGRSLPIIPAAFMMLRR